MQVTPYVFFGGRCAEALEFYQQAINAEILFMMQYKDSPEPLPEGMNSPDLQNNVMHASWKVGNSEIMSADAAPGNHNGHAGFSLSITTKTDAEAKEIYGALSAGGKQQMPLGPTFFSPCFGMLVDKFGVEWMVYVEGEQAP